MIEIVPAILTDSEEELVRLVHLLERAGVTRVHLDICDGQFVPTQTINGYDQLRQLSSSLEWDVHLMVQKPSEHLAHWQGLSVSRFIAHVEAQDPLPEGAWAALNPETPLERIPAEVTGAVFMTVHPGRQGAPFTPEVLEKIKKFRIERPGIPVMVDGGITPDTAFQCVAAGASILVSGSYVVTSADSAVAIKELQNNV